MRVLFTTQPGEGHLNPLVPLARALLAAGHEVAVACAPSFGRLVEARGLRPVLRPPGRGAWLARLPDGARLEDRP